MVLKDIILIFYTGTQLFPECNSGMGIAVRVWFVGAAMGFDLSVVTNHPQRTETDDDVEPVGKGVMKTKVTRGWGKMKNNDV